MARQQLKVWVSAAADTASWCLALSLVALLLLVCSLGAGGAGAAAGETTRHGVVAVVRGAALSARPCDEIYVVAEGETLHSISDKCGDPYILERNPHVHDPDDVFPGLVIKITPSRPRLSPSESLVAYGVVFTDTVSSIGKQTGQLGTVPRSRAFSHANTVFLRAAGTATTYFPVNLLPRHPRDARPLHQYCRETVMTMGAWWTGVVGVRGLRVIDSSTFKYSPGIDNSPPS